MSPGSSGLAAGRRRAPSRLVLVRHGQSVGNLADEDAHRRELERIELDYRDPDTPLSEAGEQQALSLGVHLGGLSSSEQPQIILTSPYVRARTTAQVALERAGLEHKLVFDERLREREFGAFDRLTRRGVQSRFPDEAARLEDLGKFYFRPPGGESWADVALRVRSLLADIRAEYDGASVWAFSHQAVIMVFRYVLEQLDENQILEINASEPLPNCSMTSYAPDETGALQLERYADTSHMAEAPVTRDQPAGQGTP